MGGPRKIKSAKQMSDLWEAFKAQCDNQMVLTHDFSAKNSEFVSKELRRSITYTIEGFCVFAGISRAAFKKINKLVTFVTTGCAILVPSKRRGRGLIPGLADLFKMLEATA